MTNSQTKESQMWDDNELFENTRLLTEKLNQSKVSLKYKIKAGSFVQDENRIYAGRNNCYTIAICEDHAVWFEKESNNWIGNSDEFESKYSWEDFMANTDLIIEQIGLLS